MVISQNHFLFLHTIHCCPNGGFFALNVSLTAFAVLVAVVTTVVGTVTHPAFGDAAMVCALKLSS